MAFSAAPRAMDAVWRIESARLIAGLTRIVRDVAVAEDLAQDALVAALEQWPESGIPDNPGAWLLTTVQASPRRAGRGRRGRRPAADLHDVPPGPVAGGARGADAAAARWALHAG